MKNQVVKQTWQQAVVKLREIARSELGCLEPHWPTVEWAFATIGDILDDYDADGKDYSVI